MQTSARIASTAIAVSLATLIAGAAQGATLWAAPGGEQVRCSAANVGSRPLEVTVTVFSGKGDGRNETSSTFNLGPSEITRVTVGGNLCKFTFRGSSRNVRATGCDSDGCVDAR